MALSAFFAWPMVHDWFVSTGMLDFALAVPLATLLLVALNAQRARPAVGRGVVIALLGLVIWYAHAFPLLVVHLLVGLEVVLQRTWSARWQHVRRLVVPLLPSTVLVGMSLWAHATEPVGAMTGFVALDRALPVWELLYNLWAEWFWAFTRLEITTIVPCIALALFALYRWREDVPFFGPIAAVVLATLYVLTPYVMTNWFHVNSRFIPFLWLAALVRLPERLPGRALAALGACALAASVGLGIDYVRLDRERARFTAGISRRARGGEPSAARLPQQGHEREHAKPASCMGRTTSSRSKRALHCSSRIRGASPSCTASRRDTQFNHLVLESFAPSMGTPDWMCGLLRSGGVALEDCEGEWRRALAGVLVRRPSRGSTMFSLERPERGHGARPARVPRRLPS